MKDFNKYTFLNELEEELKDINGEDEKFQYVSQSVDNACIYYADCYAIIAECGVTEFEFDGVTATNINQLAYMALYEYVMEELNVNA